MVLMIVVGLAMVSGLTGLLVGWLTGSAFVGWVTTLVVAVAVPLVFIGLLVWEKWGTVWWRRNRDRWAVQVAVEIVGVIVTGVVVVEFVLILYLFS